MLVSGDMPEMAMPNFLSVIPERRNDVYIVRLPNAGHNSIRDRPYLGAGEDSDRRAAAEQLNVIRTVVRQFLNTYVRDSGEFTIEPSLASHALLEAHRVSLRRD
jgi:hypothetical protein